VVVPVRFAFASLVVWFSTYIFFLDLVQLLLSGEDLSILHDVTLGEKLPIFLL
jgi:hypothetical protein